MLSAHVVKRRARFTVDVRVEVPSGGACGLFGASGAGKSTVLACLSGLEPPDGGSVALDGERLFPPELPLHRRAIGYLTQDADLFPHLRVDENVAYGVAHANGREDAWLAELRARLGLEPIWTARSDRISGGQARRVALARMLARKPRLVLLDEPFTGLDRHLVRELVGALAEWHRRLGFVLIAVDHEAAVLERLCPRTLVIEEGRIVQDGTWPQVRRSPATPLLAQLLAPL